MTNEQSISGSGMGKPGGHAARRWIRPRVVATLLVLLAAICASVILADVLSPRDRHPVPQTFPAASRSTP